MPLALAMNEPIVRSVFPDYHNDVEVKKLCVEDRGSPSVVFLSTPLGTLRSFTLLPSTGHRNRV